MENSDNLDISTRKDDHIEMAKNSITQVHKIDQRFYYEPLHGSHKKVESINQTFLGKSVSGPIWISSMTGGSVNANKVNKMLAEVANSLKLGMGLGSCRVLLEDAKYFDDFNLRPILGDDVPFMANLGIAQIQECTEDREKLKSLLLMLEKLRVDGLIIHVNPTQEFFQPGGDQFLIPPIETLSKIIPLINCPVIVKEVGQGMGPKSLKSLLELKISGVEFGAFGGTNFSKLESLRRPELDQLKPLWYVGHSAEEMVGFINDINSDTNYKFSEVIISGGITNFLDGYYLMQKLNTPCLYGMAGTVLDKLAQGQDVLETFLNSELKGLAFAKSFLRVKG